MAIFNNMSITSKGQVLYAKAQAGLQLNFTKMMVGSGDIGTQNPSTLLALVIPKYNVPIQSITPNTELKTATISGLINNSAITLATYICEIGLFATDPDEGEILYAYGSAGSKGDYMAPATSGAYSWNYQINAAIGNASNITVTLSNLQYDYGLVTTNTLTLLYGGNQKEINKSIDNMFKVYTTTNVGNAYSVTIPNFAFTDGYPITVKFNAASTGAITLKVNSLTAKGVFDYFNVAVPNVRQNLIANLRYEATSGTFTLLGKGGGGNVIPSQMLLGIKGTSDSGPVVGTIPSKTTQTYTAGTTNQTIAAGQYLSENQIILGDADLVSANVKANSNILGVQGKPSVVDTEDATASAAQIVSGYSGYVNGSKVNGNATIQSLGGIKIARYDIVSPVATESFVDTRGDTNSTYVVDITGFDFTPDYAIFETADNGTSTYCNGSVYMCNGGRDSMYRRLIVANNANIIISYGRLRIPEAQHGSCVIFGH